MHTQDAGHEEGLVEVLTQQVKTAAGDHASAEEVQAVHKHHAVRLEQRGRSHNPADVVHLNVRGVCVCARA